MELLHVIRRTAKIRFTLHKKSHNRFVMDLYELCKSKNVSKDTILTIIYLYEKHMEEINELLYMKLLPEEQNLFLRFFLKRFFSVDTATTEELRVIDKAFKEVENMYLKQVAESGTIEFEFESKKLRYYSPRKLIQAENEAERILMNYYDVTHAFFLTEYKKEGFNPKDGSTILDCGAAHGDTALMFSTLYPHSKVYSFEYSDEQFMSLKKNVTINNIEQQVFPVKAFLYSDTGKHLLDDNYRIDEYDEMTRQKCSEITTISIDDYVEENSISNIGLIKFDIEGGEQAALLGAKKTIKKYKPLIYIPIYHRHDDIYMIPEMLHELGMKMTFSLKWTEKKVWGVDCVLFVKFL